MVSGKGGTGKTSLVASFAALAKNKVLADCDVDAADLHLLLSPRVVRREEFRSRLLASIHGDKCTGCGVCASLCRFGAISSGETVFRIDPIACEGCGVCAHFCPVHAVEFLPKVNGEWFVSETRHGWMVHGKLGVAEANSGKLVALIRNQANGIARDKNLDLVIIDGSPGLGCPVIASVTGASFVLIVTEPTLSGLHDLDRVAELAAHFKIPAAVCVNKSDINSEITAAIRERCFDRNIDVLGEVRYDAALTRAQRKGISVIEYDEGPASTDIKLLWKALALKLRKPQKPNRKD